MSKVKEFKDSLKKIKAIIYDDLDVRVKIGDNQEVILNVAYGGVTMWQDKYLIISTKQSGHTPFGDLRNTFKYLDSELDDYVVMISDNEEYVLSDKIDIDEDNNIIWLHYEV